MTPGSAPFVQVFAAASSGSSCADWYLFCSLTSYYTKFYDLCVVPVLLWGRYLTRRVCVCVALFSVATSSRETGGYCFSTQPIFNLARGIFILKSHWFIWLLATGTDQDNDDFYKSITIFCDKFKI